MFISHTSLKEQREFLISMCTKNEVEGCFSTILEGFEKILKFESDEDCIENTPERITNMYFNELLAGYKQNPEEILKKRFEAENNEMIIIKDISFVSLCAHHWLPFMGKCSIGYIPKDKKLVGLSKLPRLVNCFSRRFQIQENMTSEIANALYTILKPEGCIVVCEAEHLCAKIRGIQNDGVKMVTSAVRGCFQEKEVKDEFLELR